MLVTVLPLRAVLLQILFLLITIALESFIFQRRIYLSPRTSIEYAASINLFSTISGWLCFFFFESLLSADLRKQLINFILFGQFAPKLEVSLIIAYIYLALFYLLTSVIIIIIELVVFDFLINLNDFQTILNKQDESESKKQTQTSIQKRKIARQKSKSILIANAYSQISILFILFLMQNF